MDIQQFCSQILAYHRQHGRHALPWRHDTSLYSILVSEMMLQQTQVHRVIPKYHTFMYALPTLQHLAQTSLSVVLRLWQGLGYNRRAKYLWLSSQILVKDISLDQKLPGIGPATRASIDCFTYDTSTVFIETNIRRTFLFHFFPNQEQVPDEAILPIIKQSLTYVTSPRVWYWALMDYGSYLKTIVPNPNRKSKHYTRQLPFEGSTRQKRGRLLREYLAGTLDIRQLDTCTQHIWETLVNEGLIV